MRDVAYWHNADITVAVMECPLLGVKRTSQIEAAMSAFDPKRTSAR
jgi:hypothetical protein